MHDILHSEFAAECRNHEGERICGDNYIFRSRPSGRAIAILSDGMGHGTRANILSTLTTSMLSNFAVSRTANSRIARMMDAMLPVNEATGVSYSTFTLADIDGRSGRVILVQYDNPPAILLRDGLPVKLEWSEQYLSEGRPGKLTVAAFTARAGDRLVMATDGVTQSGQAPGMYSFGWGQNKLAEFCSRAVFSDPSICSAELARQVVMQSEENDAGQPSDDISCAVVTFRRRRRMTLASCPPAMVKESGRMAEDIINAEGTKVICGQPLASMIAAHMGEVLEHDESFRPVEEFPVYSLRGFDLVTDGIIVPGRILDILEHTPVDGGNLRQNDIPSGIVVRMLENDLIDFRIGMRRNIDPRGIVPDEFSVRRNILRRIMAVLEKKFQKTVVTTYY
ncbi:MAG: serine/threonine-protein phosphatase [Rikenellaceae bacterium]|nr:serine/threonine-protein phosphatase [Rikenellaceae bacterium]